MAELGQAIDELRGEMIIARGGGDGPPATERLSSRAPAALVSVRGANAKAILLRFGLTSPALPSPVKPSHVAHQTISFPTTRR